ELWKARYKTNKNNRLRNLRREKSNPEILPRTQRWKRKCDYDYRPNSKNVFMFPSALHLHLQPNDQKSNKHKVDGARYSKKRELKDKDKGRQLRLDAKLPFVPSQSEQEEYLFRYLFDDDDYADSDSSLSLSTGEAADANDLDDNDNDINNNNEKKRGERQDFVEYVPLKHGRSKEKRKVNRQTGTPHVQDDSHVSIKRHSTEMREVATTTTAPTTPTTPTTPTATTTTTNRRRLTRSNSATSSDLAKVGASSKNSKHRSTTTGGSKRRPIGPYRGHVYAKKEWIEEEFGANAKTLYEFVVKKKDKWARDQPRTLILDISMQVLRVKDKSGKTHKEHLVSSICSFEDVYHPKQPDTQLRVLFQKTVGAVAKFQEKLNLLNKRNDNDTSKWDKQQHHHVQSLPEDALASPLSESEASPITPVNGGDAISTMQSITLDTSLAMQDGSEYTGVASTQVVYLIQYTSWGQLKTRTMIVHLIEKVVRLFGEKRKCTNEISVKMIATIELVNHVTVELVFTSKIKPMKIKFQSNNDLWYFIEQVRFLNSKVLLQQQHDLEMAKTKHQSYDDANETQDKSNDNANDHDTDNHNGQDNDDHEDGDTAPATIEHNPLYQSFTGPQHDPFFDFESNSNPDLFRYPVLRLIRTSPSKGASADKKYTWKQHRRVIYLDLKNHIIRMKTVGEHLKDYQFSDVVLLEKSYSNPNQLHMTMNYTIAASVKIRDYWYEFISPRAREEFVGRLISALPRGGRTSERDTVSALPTEGRETKTEISPLGIFVRFCLLKKKNTYQMCTHTHTHTHITKKERLSSLRTIASDQSNQVYSTTHKSTRMSAARLSLMVGSWNVAASEPKMSNLEQWFPSADVQPHDMYVIGLQECSTNTRQRWEHSLLKHIDRGHKDYVIFHRSWILQIGCIVIVHRAHVAKISHLQNQEVATGKGNMIGNKGAAVISFQFQETSFCFICCHLAARAEMYEKRAKDVFRIIKMLSVGRPGLDVLHQFHHVIFFGDMNYRVGKEFDKVCDLIKKEKWIDIVQYDQLAFQMQKKQVFDGFKEGMIDFAPTYRWERDENVISNKREQAPSYCDRILYTSLDDTYDLRQYVYKNAPNAFGSDHRPVWSVFTFVPRMPYFTNATHFQMIGDDNPNTVNEIIIESTRIDLVDLKASFVGVSGLSIHDELHATFHHYYTEKPREEEEGEDFNKQINK
ncbi:hypothetical protein RFI_15953, partial [Reticulomyxa filosa]